MEDAEKVTAAHIENGRALVDYYLDSGKNSPGSW